MIDDFSFAETHEIMVPGRHQKLYHRPIYVKNGVKTLMRWVGDSLQSFRCRLSMSLNGFLSKLIKQIGVGLRQLVSNCFTIVNAFLVQCIRQYIDHILRFFWYTFRLGRDSQARFYTISQRARKMEWVQKHSYNKWWNLD